MTPVELVWRRRATLTGLLFVFAILPAALVAVIINRYAVDVPYADEWKVIDLIERWHAQQLTFSDLYVAHNGHRIVLPRLIFLGLLQFSRGDLRAEMLCSLVVCFLTSVGIYLVLTRTVVGATVEHLALWALTNVFLFSPIQAENWLWGFQLQVFLSNCGLIGALVCLSGRAADTPRLAAAAAFAVAATFSFGNGLLVLPAGFLMLVCRREKRSVIAIWLLVALLVIIAYTRNYPGQDPHPATVQPSDYPLYFAAFIGAPLARIPNSHPLVLPVAVGTILMAAFAWSSVRLIRRPPRELYTAAPWLALGAYVLGSAAMATVARVHTGPMHALDSRYTTVSMMLVVSVIGLRASQSMRHPAKRTDALVGGALVGILLLLYAINVPSEFRYLRLSHSARSLGKAALEFSAILPLDGQLRAALLIKDDADTLTRRLNALDRFGLLSPPRRTTDILQDGEGRPKRATPEYGTFEGVFSATASFVASGWAYLPVDARPPPCVLLACRSDDEWKAFAFANVNQSRTDLVTRYESRSYLEAGWKQSFARGIVPAGAQEVSAWVLDEQDGHTYRLPGSFVLPP